MVLFVYLVPITRFAWAIHGNYHWFCRDKVKKSFIFTYIMVLRYLPYLASLKDIYTRRWYNITRLVVPLIAYPSTETELGNIQSHPVFKQFVCLYVINQLTTIDNTSLSFALVQFSSSMIAEQTFNLCQGHLIRGEAIRIAFCAPGTNASEVYNKIMMDLVSVWHILYITFVIFMIPVALSFW